MRDPTDIRGQQISAEADSIEQGKARAKELDDFRWLMSHKQGRRIVWRILEQAGVYRQTFTGNSESFFLEGKRNMGLFVLAESMDAGLEAHMLMLKENRNGR